MLRAVTRATLIVNPHASAVTEEDLAAVRRALSAVAELRVLRTEGRGHATELARGAGADSDAVLVYAGDGGANEVLNGLNGDVPVGFVPGGGTSVLPRALGLSRDAGQAAAEVARALAEGRTRRISLGRVNGRLFAFAAGVGLDAELVRRVDERGRSLTGRRAGDLAFALAAVQLLADRRGTLEPALEILGRGRAAFVLVANGRPYTYAGRLALDVAPQASFDLGLDFVAPARVAPSDIPRLLRYALRGRGQVEAGDVLYGHDLDRIEVACEAPTPVQADGEDLGDATEVVFEAVRDAVTVLV
jgi:diacylglycerol kinase family enzyme